jgi:hypothetical protein
LQRLLSAPNLSWFDNDWGRVQAFCEERGFAGLEVFAPEAADRRIPAGLVRGLHLSYRITPWLKEWSSLRPGDQAMREEMIDTYARELDLAESLGAEYAVCHAGYVEVRHALDDHFPYRDSEVIEAVAELTNLALQRSPVRTAVLFENLWWPGLRLTEIEPVRALLGLTEHQNKGLVLDTGHLMNTTSGLTSEMEGVAYLSRTLASLNGVERKIRAVHLQKSLATGYDLAAVGDFRAAYAGAKSDEERESVVWKAISRRDEHQPFQEPAIADLVQRIAPEYLVYELVARSRPDWELAIDLQDRALSGLAIGR